mmetsp:Transcript_25645/g.52517  ORF Transcript_25645/g.52517 Transcript_25645/m.52517 type:complete len:200 (-) Transcript_25645:562-1161(-)
MVLICPCLLGSSSFSPPLCLDALPLPVLCQRRGRWNLLFSLLPWENSPPHAALNPLNLLWACCILHHFPYRLSLRRCKGLGHDPRACTCSVIPHWSDTRLERLDPPRLILSAPSAVVFGVPPRVGPGLGTNVGLQSGTSGRAREPIGAVALSLGHTSVIEYFEGGDGAYRVEAVVLSTRYRIAPQAEAFQMFAILPEFL